MKKRISWGKRRMKPRRKKKQQDKGAPKWMVTFSDMMTLILVFFILLFSMSQIDLQKFNAVAESFRSRAIFDFYPSMMEFENPSQRRSNEQEQKDVSEFDSPSKNSVNQNEKGSDQKEDSLDELVKDVKSFLDTNDMTKDITADRTDRGVVLTLQEQVLFETGNAEIIQAGRPFLDKVGQLLDKIPNYVKVEGHTDNRPISTFRYPSNWELSAARASSVIRYLTDTEELKGSRFTAVGYGATRPIAPNDSPENWNKNRRVEIVILDPTYQDNSNQPDQNKASSDS